MAIARSDESADLHAARCTELLAGLRDSPRCINPKFFYDEQGSALFSQICEQPEYYPTRTEIGIFTEQAAAIARAVGPGCRLIEPGAGGCEKVRYLLPALQPALYQPLDISAEYMLAGTAALRREFPDLQVMPQVADFSDHFELTAVPCDGRAVLFYPGSTIGNFTPDEAEAFLRRATALLGTDGVLLIGVDLHKQKSVLEAAYNDAQGVTAAFNRNILRHANRLLSADFNPDAFAHLAFYNAPVRRIEMHLQSTVAQRVRGEGLDIALAAGERIHTEYSYKYSLADFAALAERAGLSRQHCWVDARDWFSVQFFAVS